MCYPIRRLCVISKYIYLIGIVYCSLGELIEEMSLGSPKNRVGKWKAYTLNFGIELAL